jgi:hypothetical protein
MNGCKKTEDKFCSAVDPTETFLLWRSTAGLSLSSGFFYTLIKYLIFRVTDTKEPVLFHFEFQYIFK